MHRNLPRVISLAAGCLLWHLPQMGLAQEKYETHTDLPDHLETTPSPARSPEEALKSFQLVDGFDIELVASEPMIEDPVLIDWDIQGRLWICEMRGFMMDIDATDQFAEVGRVSVLEDTDGDGKMDKATRYLEGLVLPRAIRVFQEGLLVAEHDKLWFVPDADGDLVPEDKVLIDAEYATYGSVEHRPNGLLMGLDNWIYNSRSKKRYQRKDNEWITDATENRGQWGITMDDYGRLYYNFHWSQLHCDIAPPDSLTRNANFRPTLSVNATVSTDQFVHPIRMNTAINRGYRPGVLDDAGKLIRFASACSPWIYRGGAFPSTFNGNAFVCAPAANTIKRNLIVDKGITVSGINAYPDRDFLASTDERFRPVSLSGGPDGSLYVVDMYRGIIQQADFMTPFLRRESERRELEQPIHLGRIYRISHPSVSGEQPPDFTSLDPAGWVDLLNHSNGWVRDKAQQWLVWQKPEAAVEALNALARKGDAPAAIHALWTLDGMGEDPFPACLERIGSAQPKVAAAARQVAAKHAASEERAEAFNTALEAQGEEDPYRTFHGILARGRLEDPEASPLFFQATETYVENPHIREALLSNLEGEEINFLGRILALPSWKVESTGKKLLIQELAACAMRGDEPLAIMQLFQLAKGHRWQNKAVREGVFLALLEREAPLHFPKNPELDDPRFPPYLSWPGHNPQSHQGAEAVELTPVERERFVEGQAIYAGLCASCHGSEGEGLQLLGPPVARSEWVTGDPDRLIRILLHGLEGAIEVRGKTYAPPEILPAMPPAGMMSDSEIAGVLTYIRRAWGHAADPVTPHDVRRNRDLTAGQVGAYQVSELSQ